MFPINAAVIRAVALLLTVAIIAGGIWYVTGLRADLVTSQANAKQLADSVDKQKETIADIQKNQTKINEINKELAAAVKSHSKDIAGLNDRFNTKANGDKRDFGTTAAAKPGLVEKLVNAGSENAARCFEIASGAPLTDREKHAKLPTEINKECPSLANPNYKPTPN